MFSDDGYTEAQNKKNEKMVRNLTQAVANAKYFNRCVDIKTLDAILNDKCYIVDERPQEVKMAQYSMFIPLTISDFVPDNKVVMLNARQCGNTAQVIMNKMTTDILKAFNISEELHDAKK